MLLIEHHAAARFTIWGTVAAGALAEVIATRRRAAGRPAAPPSRDRGTKGVLALTLFLAVLGGVEVARFVPALRVGADTWTGWAIGISILALGFGLRVWAVWSLGRYFRREVTIEPGQSVCTSGPYRFVRHPAYLGDLLIVFGFVGASGSWVAAAAGTAIALAGHLPRILVEEKTLREGLGEPYERYASGHARLLPGVW